MSTPEDHPVLDKIALELALCPLSWKVERARRESECVEFYDVSQKQWFEIVVRRIDEPSHPPGDTP